jgi:hypothetical protein
MTPTALIKRLTLVGAVGIAIFISISRSEKAPSYPHEAGLGIVDRSRTEQGTVLNPARMRPIGMALGTNKYSASAQRPLDVSVPRLDSTSLRGVVALPSVQPISMAGEGSER